jgi:hypothetical protein
MCHHISVGVYTMNVYGGLELQIHTFLIWKLDRDDWSDSKASSFKPRLRNSDKLTELIRGGWGKSAWRC